MKIILATVWMALTTLGPYYIAKHMGYMNAIAIAIGLIGFLIGFCLLTLVTGAGGGSGSSSDWSGIDFSCDSDD